MTLNFTRYIRTSSDNQFLASIAYTTIKDENENVNIYGAFFGHIGSGDYDGGFFHINLEEDQHNIISYDEAESADQSKIFNHLLKFCGDCCSDDDSSECSTMALQLLESAEEVDGEKIFMDDDFDGDVLSEISESWELRIKFYS